MCRRYRGENTIFILYFPIIIAGFVNIIKDLYGDGTCGVASKDNRGADGDGSNLQKIKNKKCGIQLLCVNAAPAARL